MFDSLVAEPSQCLIYTSVKARGVVCHVACSCLALWPSNTRVNSVALKLVSSGESFRYLLLVMNGMHILVVARS